MGEYWTVIYDGLDFPYSDDCTGIIMLEILSFYCVLQTTNVASSEQEIP